jgi:geranylgeranyl reductase family protein
MPDVVIVGAGPIGCYCARELAEGGHRVLVVEEHGEVGLPVHCTGIIGVEAYRRFRLPEECIQAPLRAARLFSPLGTCLEIGSPEVQAWVVDRRRFDQALAKRALVAGASFLLSTRVERLERRADRVLIRAQSKGEAWEIEARLCILATGTDEELARQAGLGAGPPVHFGAQTELPVSDLAQVEVYFGRRIAPGGFAWAVPTGNGKAKVGLLTSSCPRSRLRKVITEGPLAGRTCGENGLQVQCRALPSRARRSCYSRGVLAVGDAAGHVKTTTGGGIFYGLLGAKAAVGAAGRALESSDPPEELFSGYQDYCLRVLGREQALGGLFRKLAASLTDHQLDAVFRAVRRLGLPGRIAESVRFDWHASDTMAAMRTLG